ncbi:MAG: mechanosensitive ion channel [Spirochaetales bacterium]|nr:mechanosensitive ion channel [Spirochaetales bacterium]
MDGDEKFWTLTKLTEYTESLGLSYELASILSAVVLLSCLLLVSILAYFIAKNLIINIASKVVKKTKNTWDDILLEEKVFDYFAYFGPAIIIHLLVGQALGEFYEWISLIRSATYIYMIITSVLIINALLNALYKISKSSKKVTSSRGIKSYIQVVKILVITIAFFLILAILLNKKVGTIFAGLGAFVAVLMFIFQDTIKGFISSLQLSANDMVRIGDWISMPKYGADGDVVDISLHTIKIQNWDKTISTIPTTALVQDSFTNWRGMVESGGRRIARSVYIDISSIKFCTAEMLEKFKKIEILENYIDTKLSEIEQYNKDHNVDSLTLVNGRKLTNIGTFRIYLEKYLRKNPNISSDMTLLVRQLEPTERGLPIQIYCFSKVQAWADYENIQGDIFDHILSIASEFDLRIFQNPSGSDFLKLKE